MSQLSVPVPYLTIADALLAAAPGDTIVVAPDYGPETLTVSLNDITLTGPASVHGVEVFIADSVTDFVLLGEAPINVTDLGSGESLRGNAGDNIFTLTGGVDSVDGGGGDDQLVVDYSRSTGIVTASSTTIDGDLGTVEITATSIEAFTILTGGGADTLTFTTSDGANYIDAGEGANTIVVGDGNNTVKTGADIDTISVGDGNNTIDAGAGTIAANTISGGSGNNIIRGGNGVETITVGGGDNQIYAGDGANTLVVGPTGSGNNVIIAGAGIDTITVGAGNNFIDAGAGTIGANTINVGPSGAGNNTVLGSEGVDTIAIGNGNNYVAAGGGANTVTAGSGNNLITAGDAVDTIAAMGGNNVIEAEGGANTVTTGAGNDVTQTGSAADTVDTGAGNDILKDSGGAGTLTAGAGHDRMIMDYAGTAPSVSNTANNVSGTYSGVINATNYSGVEEFHITGGSGADNIVTGIGADILVGGVGADTLTAGGGSDVIYGGVGDVISGGEDAGGADFDLLVLAGFGDHRISYATDAVTGTTDTQSGRVDHLDTNGNVDGSLTFTGIESIVFADNTVFTLEDTPLEGDLFDANNTAISQTLTSFTVGTTTYNAGETAARTEGNLTLRADGQYTFVPAPNYNGPAPVITYTFTTASTTPVAGDTPMTATRALIIEVQPVAEVVPNYATSDAPLITAWAASATLHEAGGADNTTLGTNVSTIIMSVENAEAASAFDQDYLADTGWSTVDSGASYTKSGTFGTARFTVSTGAVAYTLDDSRGATQSLTSGEQVTETFTIQISSRGVISTAEAVFTILGQNDTPSLSHLQTAIVFNENTVNAGFVPLISNPNTAQGAFSVQDAEGNFDGGKLTVSGFLNEDQVRVFDQGAGIDLIDVVGSSLYFNSVLIATMAGGSTTATGVRSDLVFSFNAATSSTAIEHLIEDLQFSNAQDAASTSRTIDFDLLDGTGNRVDTPTQGTVIPTPYSTTLTIAAQNDLPTASGLPSDVSVRIATLSAVPLSTLVLADADKNDILDLVLTANNGALSALSSAGVLVAGSGSTSITATGTSLALNAWLADTSHVQFTGPAGLSGDNAALLSVSIDDGSGGVSLGSVNIDILAPGIAQMLTGLATSVSFSENTVNAAAQLMQVNVTYSNLSGDFDGGYLSLSGVLAEDSVSVQNGGNSAGQIGLSGASVSYGGVVFGTLSGGHGSDLTISFTAAATAPAIEALIESLTYANSSDTPTASRTFVLDVIDVNGEGLGAPAAPGLQAFAGLSDAASPLTGIDVGGYSAPAFADLNGDGLLDLVAGNSWGRLAAFTNTGSGFAALSGAANPFDGIDVGSRSTPAFADLDSDGKLDLVVGNNRGEIFAYNNTGAGFTALTGADNPFSGIDVGSWAAPTFVDLDGDGHLDMVVGNSAGKLLSYHNTGSGFEEMRGSDNPLSGIDIGSKSAPAFADINGDMFLFVGTSGRSTTVYQNTGAGFTELAPADNPFSDADLGRSSKPVFADINGDGGIDVVIGNSYGTFAVYEDTAPHVEGLAFDLNVGDHFIF